MFLTPVVILAALAVGLALWARLQDRLRAIADPFERSESAVRLLHDSVEAVPANAFDARLRIVRR